MCKSIGDFNMEYHVADEMSKFYGSLIDDQSRELFMARIEYDIAPGFGSLMRLINASGLYSKEKSEERTLWKSIFESVKNFGGQLCLFGAGIIGRTFAEGLIFSGIESFVFCDTYRSGTILGKKIISPDVLTRDAEMYYVIVTTSSSNEVIESLEKKGFPSSHILSCYTVPNGKYNWVNYFELFKYIPKEGAFVDAGSFDGADSVRFCQMMDSNDVYVFEPDPTNYVICKETLLSYEVDERNFFQVGLSNEAGIATFTAEGTETSHITDQAPVNDNNMFSIRTVRLDDVISRKVSMIKMDIEGSEYKALCGSKKVISKDAPFCAISVYHRRGDLLAIMSLLRELVPDYRFAIRHYTPGVYDTVLYAFKQN